MCVSSYPKYYYVNGVERRDVWKVYGIKFVVQVTGQVGKGTKKHNSPLSLLREENFLLQLLS